MSRPLSTFNFKKLKLTLVTLLTGVAVSLFILDRITFFLFFPLYDQWLRVGTSLRPSEILLVGSSHIEADIDTKLLKSLTHKDVGLFSVPGAGLTPRYYAIKQRLELTNVPKPEVIILETSKLVFNPVRYTHDVSEYLEAYANKGFFNEYVNLFQRGHANWFWYKAFESYSLNGGFEKLLDPANILRFFAERAMSNENYIKFRGRFRDSENKTCLSHPPDQKSGDPRIADWDHTRKALNYTSEIDPQRVETFKKIISLTQARRVKLILWDPPFYHFEGDPENDGFGKARKILYDARQENVQYLQLSVPNNSCLFSDEGHLSAEGQGLLTTSLAQRL